MVLDRRREEAGNNKSIKEQIKVLCMNDPCDDVTHWIGII